VVQYVQKLFARFQQRKQVLPVPGSWNVVLVPEATDLHRYAVEQPGLQVEAARVWCEGEHGTFWGEPEQHLLLH
jgi:hypothetical protein